jgi:hypothetical protein
MRNQTEAKPQEKGDDQKFTVQELFEHSVHTPQEAARRDVAEIVRRHSQELRKALSEWTITLDRQE